MKLTGFGTEESVYLNFDARGHIDMRASPRRILIGLLGVLYDSASAAIAVEELYHAAPT